eukprot:2452900-Pyramimonas_sp.AAC.1
MSPSEQKVVSMHAPNARNKSAMAKQHDPATAAAGEPPMKAARRLPNFTVTESLPVASTHRRMTTCAAAMAWAGVTASKNWPASATSPTD